MLSSLPCRPVPGLVVAVVLGVLVDDRVVTVVVVVPATGLLSPPPSVSAMPMAAMTSTTTTAATPATMGHGLRLAGGCPPWPHGVAPVNCCGGGAPGGWAPQPPVLSGEYCGVGTGWLGVGTGPLAGPHEGGAGGG